MRFNWRTWLWMVLLIAQSGSGFAAIYNWNGTVSTEWSNATNWIPPGVPGEGDTAYVSTNLTLPPELFSTVYWTNGMFSGASRIMPQGRLILAERAPYRQWSCSLTNEGLIELRSTESVYSNPYTNTVINRPGGIVRTSVGANVLGMAFENYGRVEVLGGVLSLAGGVLAGEYFVADGAALHLMGGYAPNGIFRLQPYIVHGGGFFGVRTVSPDLHLRLYGILQGPLEWDRGSLSGGFTIGKEGVLKLKSSIPYPGFLYWSAAVTNEGLVEIETNTKVYNSGPYSRFINTTHGGVRKIGETNGWFDLEVPLENYGRVEVQTGAVNLRGGGVISGKFEVSSNALLRLAGGSCWMAEFAVSGSGFFGVDENSNLQSPFSLVGLHGVMNGPLEWRGGAISGSDHFTIGTNGTLTIRKMSATPYQMRMRTLTNAGLIDIVSDVEIGGPCNLVNAPTGILRKTDGTNTSTRINFLTLENHGSIESHSGLLQLQDRDWSFVDRGGSLKLFNASIQIPGTFVLRGELTGTGSFIGSVTNQGVIRPGVGTRALTIQGNLTQTLDGMLDIQLGGTTQHGQLVVTGTARLHGGINVSHINGYVPSVSDTFRVLAASAVSGALPRQNGVNILGEFRRLNVAINSTSVDLMAEVVQEEVPRLNITTLQPATVAWPAEFDGWHLMTSTNLSDPSNWVESLSSSNFTTVTAPDKERYWKLVKP